MNEDVTEQAEPARPTPRMNAAVKQQWVAALRSGDYKQGIGQLRNEANGYCCLGVLSDIYAQETHTEWAKDEDGPTPNQWSVGGSAYLLGDAVTEWAETEYIPTVPSTPEGVRISLSSLNDSGDYDFNQIADLIEQHL